MSRVIFNKIFFGLHLVYAVATTGYLLLFFVLQEEIRQVQVQDPYWGGSDEGGLMWWLGTGIVRVIGLIGLIACLMLLARFILVPRDRTIRGWSIWYGLQMLAIAGLLLRENFIMGQFPTR